MQNLLKEINSLGKGEKLTGKNFLIAIRLNNKDVESFSSNADYSNSKKYSGEQPLSIR